MTAYLATVRNGKIIIDMSEFTDGTKLELEIIKIYDNETSLIDQLASSDIEVVKTPDLSKDTGTLTIKDKLFTEFELSDLILRAVSEVGYRHPSPIQLEAIPPILEGRDILATAQTGSGKTAAFSLPIIELLSRKKIKGKPYPRALIISPTRELATQIGENFFNYAEHTRIRQAIIYGGVSQKQQVRQLQRGKDVIVATPGRLLDLIQQGYIETNRIEILVLDEADRMLDMGFIRDIQKVMRMIPNDRQTLLFSATMPNSILKLSENILDNPVNISVDPVSIPVDTIDSHVFFVAKANKFDLLLHILDTREMQKVLIFSRTKYGANKMSKKLNKHNMSSDAIHGDKSQNARIRALNRFKENDIKILVATDIAARGLDIDDITHVINYDISNEPETYVHRIGRTARAGKSGIAYSFCDDDKERGYLIDIEKLIGKQLIIDEEDYPFKSTKPVSTHNINKKKNKRQRKNKPDNRENRSRKRYKSKRSKY